MNEPKPRHPRFKLNVEKARAIRKDTRRTYIVAADYGVSESLVSNIRAGRVWRKVQDQSGGDVL